jgi:GntR family transcriptional regulator
MPDPMYRRIAEDLQGKIESGELAHGSQIPTELELREEYDASRNTVRDAIKWLITRGLVETRPGQGTFVVEKIDPFVTTLTLATGSVGSDSAVYASEVTARSRKGTVSSPRVEIQQAEGVIASELQLETGSTVVVRHQQRFIDGTPWSLQTTFYPMTLVERGANMLLQAQDMPAGAVRYLEEALGIKQIAGRDLITVRAPDANEVTFFSLPGDGRIAVFEIFRTSYEESGTPLRLTVTTYPADRNQFVVNFSHIPVPAFGAGEKAAQESVTGTGRKG